MEISAKVTSKGQVTLPKTMRDDLGIDTGDAVKFVRDDSGNYTIRRDQKNSIESLKGILQHDGPSFSSDEIVELVRLSREGRGAEFIKRRKQAET